jgi:guanylate kinase
MGGRDMEKRTVYSKPVRLAVFTFAFALGTTNLLSKSTIIILKGLSRAGKSTIINKLIESNPKIKSVSEDDVFLYVFNEFIKQKFPLEYKELVKNIAPDNLYHAIARYQIKFKYGCSDEKKEEANIIIKQLRKQLEDPSRNLRPTFSKLVRETRNDMIDTYLKNNKHIIIDGVMINQKEIKKLGSRANVINIFVHCPFYTTLKRLVKKNEETEKQAIYRELRFYRNLLSSFSHCYRVTQNQNMKIFSVRKNELLDLLNTIRAELEPSSQKPLNGKFTNRDFTKAELDSYEKKLLSKLKLENKDLTYLCLNADYDYIIYNDDNVSLEGVIEQLSKFISHNVKKKQRTRKMLKIAALNQCALQLI